MNGIITSLGLMIWVYISMRALYQAEESKTWYGFFEAAVGVSFINYFCYELIMNSASLNEFKQMSKDDTDSIGLALAAGTTVALAVAALRAFKRLHSKPVMANLTDVVTRLDMKGLKDDIFQLEVEHVEGRISQQDYAKAKAALIQKLD